MSSVTKAVKVHVPCVACNGEMNGYPEDIALCDPCEEPRLSTVSFGLNGPVYTDPIGGVEHALTPELFIERSGWRFARTMPYMPHEYTVRDRMTATGRKTTCMSHDSFEWFVRLIRLTGVERSFGKRAYVYLEIGEWEYWTMGSPVKWTTILNRQTLEARDRRLARLSK